MNSTLALPKFLKLISSDGLPMPKAIAIAGRLYKEHKTPAQLVLLTDAKLKQLGVNEKEDRKHILSAIRKAGFSDPQASSSAVSAVNAVSKPSPKKRKRQILEPNDLLPEGPKDEAAVAGSLEFDEVLDEEVLRSKFVVINRAPLLTAWSCVVAEKLGFKREEALSIASAYTEMNAISKGVSLGIYDKGKQKEQDELVKGGSQPYVDLMGRRVPLYQTQSNEWRAISSGSVALPATSFSYISRSFRQTTPHIIGALRLLADSYSPSELNAQGWALYIDFRPTVEGWGDRSEVRCDVILRLRKPQVSRISNGAVKDVLRYELPEKKVKLDDDYDDAFDDSLDNIDFTDLP